MDRGGTRWASYALQSLGQTVAQSPICFKQLLSSLHQLLNRIVKILTIWLKHLVNPAYYPLRQHEPPRKNPRLWLNW